MRRRVSAKPAGAGQSSTSERLLAVLRLANAEVAAALGREDGDEVIHLRTLRRVNGVPVSLIDHYLPALDWWPALQHFTSGSLHDFLARELQQSLTRRQTRISARRRRRKKHNCWKWRGKPR